MKEEVKGLLLDSDVEVAGAEEGGLGGMGGVGCLKDGVTESTVGGRKRGGGKERECGVREAGRKKVKGSGEGAGVRGVGMVYEVTHLGDTRERGGMKEYFTVIKGVKNPVWVPKTKFSSDFLECSWG